MRYGIIVILLGLGGCAGAKGHATGPAASAAAEWHPTEAQCHQLVEHYGQLVLAVNPGKEADVDTMKQGMNSPAKTQVCVSTVSKERLDCGMAAHDATAFMDCGFGKAANARPRGRK